MCSVCALRAPTRMADARAQARTHSRLLPTAHAGSGAPPNQHAKDGRARREIKEKRLRLYTLLTLAVFVCHFFFAAFSALGFLMETKKDGKERAKHPHIPLLLGRSRSASFSLLL